VVSLLALSELEALLALEPKRRFRGVLYRWVSPEHPLPSSGPSSKDCATAGSYIYGRRMNAKGVQAPLYTAPRAAVAALEVTHFSPATYESIDKAIVASRDFLAVRGYQLFAINVDLYRVLDLSHSVSLVERYLETDWDSGQAVCQGPHPTIPSQELGRAAFQAGFEAIYRPSIFLREKWGIEADVVDLFCPNLKNEVRWRPA